ncbi:LamG-like jellyroll fold domain-containing protein, partial [Candidatus Omnitrophota bacterium]
GDASITIDGPGATTTLYNGITTEGQSITIDDSVIIAGTEIVLNTTSGGQSGGAGITIEGAINADADASTRNLTFNAGTSGVIDVNGTVGDTVNDIDDLTITNCDSGDFASTVEIDGNFAILGGDITQNGAFNIGGDYIQSAGSFTCSAPQTHTFTVGGDFTIPTTDNSFKRYTGTSPRILYDVYGLQAMKQNLSASYQLANDIDASVTSGWTNGFYPIGGVGSTSNPFTGNFDGAGHKIMDLTIATGVDGNYIGFFGYALGGEIKNVGFVNPTLTLSGPSDQSQVAIVAGRSLSTTISNVYVVNPTVSSTTVLSHAGIIVGVHVGTIENSYVSGGTITGTYFIGGFVGYHESHSSYGDGIIRNSYSTCTAIQNLLGGQSNHAVGGLVGKTKYSSGAAPAIINSYATGTVNGDPAVTYRGRLVGIVDGSLTVTNCGVWTGSGGNPYNDLGGISDVSGEVTNRADNENYFYSRAYDVYDQGGANAWDFASTWHARVDDYPFLQMESETITWEGDAGASDYNWSTSANWDTGTVPTSKDYVVFSSSYDVESAIDTAFSVYHLTINTDYDSTITQGANLIVNGDYSQADGVFTCSAPQTYTFTGGGDFSILATDNTFVRYTLDGSTRILYDVYGLQAMKQNLAGDYTLANDIDASDTANWNNGAGFEAIGDGAAAFAGNFDGNNHKITGLFISLTNAVDQGLFGLVSAETPKEIKNVGLVDPNITILGSSAARTGALIGRVDKGATAVLNCYVTGSIKITGTYNVGGLVGYTTGDVKNSYATIEVDGYQGTGGLIGIIYNYAAHPGTATIENCYATGNVTAAGGAYHTGGLLGQAQGDNVIVRNSYATGNVTGGSVQTGGFSGLNCYGAIIENCYSTGSVVGNSETGSFLGANHWQGNYGVIINNGVWTGAGPTNDIGAPASDLPGNREANKSAFYSSAHDVYDQGGANEWDFSDAWIVNEGQEYPTLQMQYHIWTNAAGDNLTNTPGNWSKGTVPSTTSHRAIFNNTSDANATVNTSLNINSFFATGTYDGVLTLGANVTTDSGDMTFNCPVVLSANVALSTGTGAGNIEFKSTLGGESGGENLTLTAGTGAITFAGAVGGSGSNPYDSAVSYWNFDGQNADDSGTVGSNDGIINGNPQWVSGISGDAIEVSSDYINCGNDATLSFGSGDFTVSLWQKPYAASVYRIIYYDPQDTFWSLQQVPDGGQYKPRIWMKTNSTSAFSAPSTQSYDYGEWTLLTLTRQAEDVRLYVNDSLQSLTSGVSGSTGDNGTIYIGAFAGNQTFNGSLDEVAVWGRGLGVDEIQAMYGGGNGYSSSGAPLGDITITSAGDVNVDSTMSAASFVQQDTDNTGTTTFSDIATISGTVDITTGNIQTVTSGLINADNLITRTQTGINVTTEVNSFAALNSSTSGNIQIVNTGTLNVTELTGVIEGTVTGVINNASGGAISLQADEIKLSKNLTSTNGTITLTGPTVLAANLIEISTGAGAGDITFNSALGADSRTSPRNLTLTAGDGNILFAGAVGSSSQGIYNDLDLVSYWSFDEGSGPTAYDYKEVNDGTLSDPSDPDIWTTGKVGDHSLDFDGDDYLDIGGSSFASGAWSVSYWFNVDAHDTGAFPHHTQLLLNGSRLVFGTTDHANYGDYYFGWTGMGARMEGPEIAVGSWVHTTVTYNGGGTTSRANYKGYINGEEIALNSANFTQTQTGNSLIGARYYGGYTNFTDGRIDEFSVWEKELNVDEIQTLYEGISLGDITITSAGDVTANSTINAASFTQSAGTGTTEIKDSVTTTGVVDITTSGIKLGGDITTTNASITFDGPVVLADNVVVSTDTGAGDITFSSTLDSDDTARSLDLTAGTGNIAFNYAVGGLYENAMSYWNFDDGNGTTAEDSVGSNDGTLYDGGTVGNGPVWTTGKVGDYALNFDGSNDFIVTAYNVFAKADFSNGLTMAAWTNMSADGVDDQIVAIEGGYWLGIDASAGSKFAFEIDGNGSPQTVASTAADGTWYFVVGTADGDGNTTIYVNGVSEDTASETYYNIDGLDRPASIGAHLPSFPANTANVTGTIDEVAIWNRALDINEIKTLYGGGAGYTPAALGAITINSAANVTANSTINAASFTQSAGTGTTTLDGQVDLTGLINVNTDTIDINAAINTGGTQDYTSSGSTTYLGANLTSTDAAITFNGPVVLTANVAIDTVDQTGANIAFGGMLDSDDTARSLELGAGSGNILFAGAIGSNEYSDAAGYWALEDSTNTADVVDAINPDNPGTLLGGNNTQDLSVAGKVGNALHLDGSSDYIPVGTSTMADGWTSITISAWVYRESNDEQGIVFHRSAPYTFGGLAETVFERDMFFLRDTPNTNAYVLARDVDGGPILAETDQWRHLVGVWDLNTGKVELWRDGSLTSTQTYDTGFTAINQASKFNIGYDNFNSDRTFDGIIDEVAIWNRALDASEIETLYGGGEGYAPPAALGAITITSAANVTANSTVNAASFTQSAGTGTTEIKDSVTTIGVVDITTSGIKLGGDITTTNASITFDGPVVLTDNVALSTGTGAGDITFGGTLDSDDPLDPKDLTLDAGSGNILFSYAVGGLYESAVSYWNFDGNMEDSIGNSDGTPGGNPQYTGSGKVNGAYGFNGDDYIDCGNDPGLVGFTNAITVSLWVKLNTLSSTQMFIEDGSSYNADRVYMDYEAGHDAFGFHVRDWDGTWYMETSTTVPVTDQWYHVAGTYDSGNNTIKIYVDGTEEASLQGYLSGELITGNTNFMIGRRPNGGLWTDGAIDEVAVFDKALDINEIKTLYGNDNGYTQSALGAIQINSAANVTANSTINAASFTSDPGTTPGTTAFNGDVTLSGALDATNSIVNIDAVMDIIGTSTLTADVTLQDDADWTLNALLDIDGDITLVSGSVLNAGGNNIEVAGDWTNSGGTFTHGNNTVTFDGSGAQTINSGGTGTGKAFYDVIISSSSNTVALSTNAIDIDNDLTINLDATFDTGGQIVNVDNDLTSSGKITTSTGDIDLDVGGTLTLSTPAGNSIETDGGDIDLSGCLTIVLGANTVLDTETGDDNHAGDIVFADNSNIDGSYTLTLNTNVDSVDTYNGGNVTLGNIGATSPLTALSVNTLGSGSGTNGTITTNGTINVAGSISFNGGAINLNKIITTTNAGLLTITNLDTLTIAATCDMSLDGAFLQDGAGDVSTAGDITTTSDDITFSSDITFTGHVAITSGSSGSGKIRFKGHLEGTTAETEDLTITAGSDDIIFEASLGGDGTGGGVGGGGPPLGQVTIVKAQNVTVYGKINAASFTQTEGSATTTLNDQADISGAISINTLTITINTNADITSSLTSGDAIILTSGSTTINLGADLTTSGGNILLSGPVVLTDNVAISTGTGAGDIEFKSTLDGENGGEDLTLTAGTGNITFNYAVGGLYESAVAYWAFDDGVGSSTAVDSVGGHDATLYNMGTSSSVWVTGKVGTSALRFSAEDEFNDYAETDSSSDFTLDTFTYSFWAKKDDTSQPEAIFRKMHIRGGDPLYDSDFGANFYSGFMHPAISSGDGADAYTTVTDWNHYTVVYDGTDMHTYLNGSLYETQADIGNMAEGDGVMRFAANQLTQTGSENYDGILDEFAMWGRALDATEIKTLYGGDSGYSQAALGDITINTAGNVTANSTVNAASFTQTAGTGTTELKGDVTTTGVVDITTSNIKLDADITTTNASITFDGPVVLTDNVALSTGTGVGDITFGGTLDSDSTARDLTLATGTGNIVFTGAVGSGAPATSLYSDPSIVAYWSLDGATPTDDSVNTNDGTIYGGVSLEAGKHGNAYRFHGVDGEYVLVTGSAFDLQNHTTSVWFLSDDNGDTSNPEWQDNTRAIFAPARNYAGGYESWAYNALWIRPDGSIGHYQRGGQLSSTENIKGETDPGTIQTGTWYHAVSIMGDGGNSLYINGVKQDLTYAKGSAASTESWAETNFGQGPDFATIGILPYSPKAYYFDGLIDEPAVWNRALNDTEIQQLYAGIPLGDITITSAGNVTASSTVNAASFTQTAGTGTTEFKDTINTTGVVDITTSGIKLGGDITTTNASITFDGPVVLTDNVALSTDTGAGDITFGGTLDSGSADLQNPLNITLAAGAGNITFTGAIGGLPYGMYNDPNTESYWNFDDSLDPAKDSAGSDDGTLFGAEYTSDSKFGAGALEFVRSESDYVQFGNTVDDGWSTEFAVSVWVKYQGVPAHLSNYLVSNRDVNTAGFMLQYTSDHDSWGSSSGFLVANAGLDFYGDTDELSTSDWNHIVAVFKGSGNRSELYYNGQLQAPHIADRDIASGNYTPTNQNLELGRYKSGVNYLDGILDEVAIWGRALTSDEVQALNQGVPLGDITITSAANVTANSTINAASFTQSAGTGTTMFDGQVDLSGAISVNTDTIDINAAINTGGTQDYTSSASTTYLGANLTSTDAAITFAGPVVLTANVAIDTVDQTGGNITFNNALDSDGVAAHNLTLTAGTGEVTFGGAVGAGESVYGDNACVNYWKLDNDATDSEGNNDGTLVGDPEWASGVVGRALSFDGDGDYIDYGASIIPIGDKTVSLWFKSITNGAHQVFLLNGLGGTDALNGFEISKTALNYVYVTIGDGGGGGNFLQTSASATYTDGQWHHLVAVQSSNELYMYMDGSFDTSDTVTQGSETIADYNLRIGNSNRDPLIYDFNGLIDEVAVWNRALDADDVKLLHGAALGAITINSAGNVQIDSTVNAASHNITLSGDWTNTNSSDFGAGTGTVTFNGTGTSQITGSTTFDNFTCVEQGKTLVFEAGETQTISGVINLNGQNPGTGNFLVLESSSAGSAWYLTVENGSPEAYNVDVSDSDASGGQEITAHSSKNSTPNENVNWVFSATDLTWNGSTDNDWAIDSNWDLGYIPNSTDDVTIPDKATTDNDPWLDMARTLNSVEIETDGLLQTQGYSLTATQFIHNYGEIMNSTAAGGNDISLSSFAITTELINNFVSGGAVTLTAGTINLYDNVASNGGDITFDGQVVVYNSINILSADNGGIEFTNTVDGASGTENLLLSAVTGPISFNGAVGSNTSLGAISIYLASDVTISSAINAASFVQDDATATTNIGGNITATVGEIRFDGPAILTNNVTLDTSAGNGNITFASTLDSDDPQDPKNLTLEAGSGNILFSYAVGGLYESAISYWSLDGNTNDYLNNNDGTFEGNPQYTGDGNGKVGGAYMFDGADDCINFGNVLLGFNKMTVSAWVRIDSQTHPAYMGPWGQQEFAYPPSTDIYAFYTSGTGFGTSAYFSDGTPYNTRAAHSIDDAQWHHIAQVYNGDTINQYDNGVLVNSADVANDKQIGNSYDFLIGKVAAYPASYLVTSYFDGSIDEVSVWDSALDGTEIKALYGNDAGYIPAALGDILITSAGNVTASSTVNAASFTQTAGTGTTELKDAVNTTGVVDITTSGIKLGCDITTTNASITFDGPVVLTDNVALSTGTGAGDITFGSTLDSDDAARDLTLTAGSGNILFSYAVGGLYEDAVSYWNLDGNANDSIGANHGTLEGNPTWTTGKVGDALIFDGTDDYINVGDDISLSITGDPLTISMWMETNVLPGPAYNAILFGSDELYGYGFYLKKSSYELALGKVGTNEVYSADAVSDTGNWHHVAVVYDSDNVYFYIDGNSDSSNPHAYSSTYDAGKHYDIGARGGANRDYYNGKIDEVAVWDRALSETEITTLYGNNNGYAPAALGAIQINSAGNVTANSTVNAASFTQSAGTGTTTFDGQVDLTGVISVNTDTIDINAAINTGGTQDYTSSASTTYLGANLTSTDAAITFAGPVVLTDNVAISTGTGAGNITFGSTLNSDSGSSPRDLTIVAGEGHVVFTGSIGGGLYDDAAAYWAFEEGQGDTVHDYLGGNDATLYNSPVWATGIVGSGVKFEGVDDYFYVDALNVANTATATVSMWYYAYDDRDVDNFWAFGSPPGEDWKNSWLTKFEDDNRPGFTIPRSGSFQNTAKTNDVIQVGSWQHIVATYDGSTMKTYVNGVEQNDTYNISTEMYFNQASMRISHSSTTYHLEATVDETAIWTRVLSLDEIQDLYNSDNGYAAPALGSITIESAGNVTVGSSVNAASFEQVDDGVGVSDATEFKGNVTTTAVEGVVVHAPNINLDAVSISTAANGPVNLDGMLTLDGNAAITAAGSGNIILGNTGDTVTGDYALELAADTGDINLMTIDVDTLTLTSGDDLTLNGNVTVDSALSFVNIDDIIIAANCTIAADDGTNKHVITFDSENAINDNVADTHTLAFVGDTVTLYTIGNTAPPSSLTVTSATETSLYGNLTVDGNVTLNNAAILYDNIAIDTDTAGTDGNIWFKDIVCSDTDSSARNLTLTAGSGNITFTGAVGSNTIDLSDGLVSQWTMNDSDTNSTVADSYGSNGGTLVDGVNNYTSDHHPESGKIGGALSFDGSNDMVRITSDQSLNTGNALTLCVWAKPTGTLDSYAKIIEKDYAGGSSPYISYGLSGNYAGSGKFAFELSADGSIKSRVSNTTHTSGAWYHIVGVWDGSVMSMYVNGASDTTPDTKTGTMTFDNSKYLRIGNSRYENNEQFLGLIDDVRIYDKALSEQEISAIYNGGGGTEALSASVTAALGAIQINSAGNVTANSTVNAASFVQ